MSFELVGGATSMVGRNGMGKTTLCNAIVGIPPARVTGSIRYRGTELVGQAFLQDREARDRLRPAGPSSLPVALGRRAPAHGRGAAGSKQWTIQRVYELFPRLAERRRNGGAQLSGGEQQMLAIGRALLTNPSLLIMDEPSEGLAPAIIEQLIETFRALEQEGLAILLIEQNLGMATAIAERQLVMVAGHDRGGDDRCRAFDRHGAAAALPRRRAARGACVVPTVVLLGTLDTKGIEYAFLRERVEAHGVEVLVVDAGVNEPVGIQPDVSRDEVARAAGASAAELAAAGDRGAAVTAMGAGAEAVVLELHGAGRLDGILALGGSGGSSIAARAMRALPVGVPKLLVSTVASGDTRPYVGAVDVTMMYSVVDIAGVNRVSARIMANAAGAIAGMVASDLPALDEKPLVAATMFGVTTPASRPRANGSRSTVTRCSSSTPPARAASRWRRSRRAASWWECSTRRRPSSRTSWWEACSRPGRSGWRRPARSACRRSSRSAPSTWSTSARVRAFRRVRRPEHLRAQPDRDADAHDA